MDPDKIKMYLNESLNDPAMHPPLFMWGGPGIGKSSVAKQVITEANQALINKNKSVNDDDLFKFIDVRMLLLDPTDLRGIIMPKNGKAVWFSPEFLPKSGRGIIIFDELNCAPPMVQNSGLQLFLDRKLGEYVVPDGFVCTAAGNHEGQGFVNKMAPALKNRFIHQEFDVSVNSWSKWAFKNDINATVIGFLARFRPALINEKNPKTNAFPTPRTWEFASKLISNNIDHDMVDELLIGTIGEGAAIEFKTYRQIWSRLPDFDEILNGKDIIPKGVDMTYALITGLITKANTKAHFNRILEYVLLLEREFAIFMVKLLWQKNRSMTTACPNWQGFSEIMAAEGIAI